MWSLYTVQRQVGEVSGDTSSRPLKKLQTNANLHLIHLTARGPTEDNICLQLLGHALNFVVISLPNGQTIFYPNFSDKRFATFLCCPRKQT